VVAPHGTAASHVLLLLLLHLVMLLLIMLRLVWLLLYVGCLLLLHCVKSHFQVRHADCTLRALQQQQPKTRKVGNTISTKAHDATFMSGVQKLKDT
jgi:hypothetical protein